MKRSRLSLNTARLFLTACIALAIVVLFPACGTESNPAPSPAPQTNVQVSQTPAATPQLSPSPQVLATAMPQSTLAPKETAMAISTPITTVQIIPTNTPTAVSVPTKESQVTPTAAASPAIVRQQTATATAAPASSATPRPKDAATATPQLKALPKAPPGIKPNVIVVTIDTLRGDHVGAFGNQRIKTPNLDALALQGARFTNAYSQYSQTNPSHASIFTSAYVTTHKLRVHGLDRISDDVTTLAEALAKNGYQTSGIFSWPSFDRQSGLDRGFQNFQGVYVPVTGQTDYWRQVAARANLTSDAVIKWAQQSAGQPYFLWVHYQDPHYPYTPPPPFDTMYDPDCTNCVDGSYDTIDRIHAGQNLSPADLDHLIALYDGQISFTDQEIGRLLSAMKEAKLLDNTIIVVTADHGESFNDNGVWFHPNILYNSVLKVPLIINYTAAIPAGTTVDAAVQNIDVMPTVLDYLGIQFPPSTEGRSLWNLIVGNENGQDRAAFAENLDDSVVAMATRDWKMIRNPQTGETKLFDLRNDPGELRDLAASNPAQVAAMMGRFNAWLDSHGIPRQ